jgi:hypothetical protein
VPDSTYTGFGGILAIDGDPAIASGSRHIPARHRWTGHVPAAVDYDDFSSIQP